MPTAHVAPAADASSPRPSWLVRVRFVVYAALLVLALALIVASRTSLGSATAATRPAPHEPGAANDDD
jgi:hypothetical protein